MASFAFRGSIEKKGESAKCTTAGGGNNTETRTNPGPKPKAVKGATAASAASDEKLRRRHE